MLLLKETYTLITNCNNCNVTDSVLWLLTHILYQATECQTKFVIDSEGKSL